jgi:integral membrane protein (TIGR01906 family)
MFRKKIIIKTLSIILMILFSLTIILSSVLNSTFDNNFYYKQFNSNKSISFNSYNKTIEIIKYFKIENKSKILFDENEIVFQNSSFSEREKEHLNDIRLLINKTNNIYKFINYFVLILLSFLLLYIFKTKNQKNKLFYLYKSNLIIIGGSIILTILFVSIISVFGLLSFHSSFSFFHKIFFENNSWIFPKDSLLITLYPLNFFKNFFWNIIINIIKTTITYGSILIFIIIYMRIKNKNSRQKNN